MIAHKITPTPDEVCRQCSQHYEGECRAFSVPHSPEEEAARSTGYGMECDPPHLKEIRRRRYGTLYRT